MPTPSKKPPVVRFVCTHCDGQFSKWQGRCETCQSWGTLKPIDEVPAQTASIRPAVNGKAAAVTSFSRLASEQTPAVFSTRIGAVDRVLSGGLVPGSVTLIGGEPGVGKSTLLAQIALEIAHHGASVLYVTGEESPQQVLRRLQRLTDAPVPSSLQFLDATDASAIAATILKERPTLTIVDSIQSVRVPEATGEAGNPTQIRASASSINEAAKRAHAAVILVGQVTKDGDLAGPRLLEHLVDTVLMLEGDRGEDIRVLRALKHRFGTTDESALFTIHENGLQEILDPSVRFLHDRTSSISGSVVGCSVDGQRALLCELQALVTPAGYGIPARRIVGIDPNRVHLLIAILARRASCRLSDQDVFVNTVGGLRLTDPAMDLAVCLALASAAWDQPVRAQCLALGEVSLSGDLRPIPRLELRLKEARRLGFTHAIIPAGKVLPDIDGIELLPASTLAEAVRQATLKPVHKAAENHRNRDSFDPHKGW